MIKAYSPQDCRRIRILSITVRHAFVVFVEGIKESAIRNAELATLFLLLFVENHFAFTIFFCISFFNYRILSRKSQKSS